MNIYIPLLFFSLALCGEVILNSQEIDLIPKQVVWCGNNNNIVIILTEQNTVYKTVDRGSHWKNLNDVLVNTGKEELTENENEIGKVSSIIQSPADKSLLIFLGTHGINWVGENCAESITALNNGRTINEFYFHPSERNWALASAYTLCEDFEKSPCKIYKEVFLTTDLGRTWKPLAKYVVQFSWGVVEKKQIDKGVPKERIIISYEPHGEGNQINQGWNYKIDCVYSDDFFKTTVVLASKGNKFLLTNHYLFIAQVLDTDTQEVLLLGSKSTHKEYDLHPIETNQKSFLEHSYTFLDTSLHSVFLHMNHFGEGSQYGHIYTSGPKGLKYNLSLRNNVIGSDGRCDFEKVNSVEGVYIANAISGKYMKIAQYEIDSFASNSKDSMGKPDSSKNNSSHKEKNTSYKDFIKTLITFNKGGDWKRLTAPKTDSEGKEYNCGEYCFLNLFGSTSNYPEFYSSESAAGIIIGNGNVGHYLSHDEVSTFLSRDGGLTWFEVKKGSHIYEIGDHGGLILIADNFKPTNKVYYSWDEGITWEEKEISEDKFYIKNIITEPTGITHNFIVYGEKKVKGSKEGVVIGIDFSNVYPQCKNPSKPDSSNSDYETWSPNDGRSGKECILGHRIKIVRRKREARCVNNETFERKVFVENCDCGESDYQCDIGYQRNEPGNPCLRTDGKAFNEEFFKNQPPENCENFYTISQGYRKIPGDTCKNGYKYDPIIVPCPVNFSVIKLFKGIFYFFLISIACIFCFRYFAPPMIVTAVKNYLNELIMGGYRQLKLGDEETL